jgi:hypothetical protein
MSNGNGSGNGNGRGDRISGQQAAAVIRGYTQQPERPVEPTVQAELKPQSNGVLRIEVQAAYEECVGMPGFGSVRWGLRSTIHLGRRWCREHGRHAIDDLTQDISEQLRNRIRVQVEGSRREVFARSLGYAREALEATERLKLEVRNKLQDEAASRHAATVPVSSNGVVPQSGPRMVERNWNDEQRRLEPIVQQQQLPQTAPVPQQPAWPPPASAPAAPWTQQAPANGQGPKPSAKAGQPPKTAKEFSPWMRRQSAEAQQVAQDLMRQANWGWQYNALTDLQAMQLYDVLVRQQLV